ncbi:MAG: hypothetical protein E5299_01791 [Burkholderia gladioli]|nr:MAG: hypothetical protein E5299_01791 [Burkholderia gladioli]
MCLTVTLWPELLDQIPRDEKIDVIGGDGAYDTKPCHADIAARSAVPSIPPREGAAHWPADKSGAAWRNGAVDAIARDGRRSRVEERQWLPPAIAFREFDVSVPDPYRQLSLGASASSTAWRTSLVRNPFVSPEIMPVDAIASSRSIYATTPCALRRSSRIQCPACVSSPALLAECDEAWMDRKNLFQHERLTRASRWNGLLF